MSIWPALDRMFLALERALYQIPWLQSPLSSFDSFTRPALLPNEPSFYRHILLCAGFFLTIVGLNWVAPRFWCRYLCPLGALLGLTS